MLVLASCSQDLGLGLSFRRGWILDQLVQLTHLFLNICDAFCVVEECILDCFEELGVCVELTDADVEISHCVAALLGKQVVTTAGAYIDLEAFATQPALLLVVDRHALTEEWQVCSIKKYAETLLWISATYCADKNTNSTPALVAHRHTTDFARRVHLRHLAVADTLLSYRQSSKLRQGLYLYQKQDTLLIDQQYD